MEVVWGLGIDLSSGPRWWRHLDDSHFRRFSGFLDHRLVGDIVLHPIWFLVCNFNNAFSFLLLDDLGITFCQAVPLQIALDTRQS